MLFEKKNHEASSDYNYISYIFFFSYIFTGFDLQRVSIWIR